jgi:chaperone modulatory protein CbpM
MMTLHITESVWVNAPDKCSFDHLIEVSGLLREELLALIEAGIVNPSNHEPNNYVFHTECIVIVRVARRLRDDFELDAHGLALALTLRRRIDELEAELASLHARLG